jgi:hydroxyacylglutathione hydrolase
MDRKGPPVFFRQVLYRDLGCASYLLGDGGEAVVVDPRWDIDVYLEIAAAEQLRITDVIDTHEHADHVSGRARLLAATGARGHRPLRPGAPAAADTIAAGDTLELGTLRLTALGTPGHRPEHLAFTVADLSRSADPWLLLTGDSLLVGDVARPDLAYEPDEGARALHATLARLLAELGDGVEVWPAHVGGSLCGGAGLSHKTSSTIGYERRANPPLALAAERFVEQVTRSLPCRPPNIDRIVSLNCAVRPAFPAEPERLADAALAALLRDGVAVLDSRSPDAFDAGHLAGAVNLPVASAGLGTRAGWALDPGSPLVVVAGDETARRATVSALEAVGFWTLAGAALADVEGWRAAGLPVATSGAWDVDRLAGHLRAGAVDLIDVRELPEWLAGHVPGSHHVPLNRVGDVGSVLTGPAPRPTAVACAAGVRAAFAASLLRRSGRDEVVRVAGGGIGDLASRGIALAVGP